MVDKGARAAGRQDLEALKPDEIRNVVLVGPSSGGKTTLLETLLVRSGATCDITPGLVRETSFLYSAWRTIPRRHRGGPPGGLGYRRTMRRYLLPTRAALILLAAACAGCSSTAASAPVRFAPLSGTPAAQSSAAPTSSAVDACTSAYLAKLTPRQKLAQLLTIGVANTADALNAIRTEHIGGIFIGSGTDQAILTPAQATQLQTASTVPLLVSIDEEGGRVSRVKNLIGAAPAARTITKTMTAEQAYQQALTRGKALKKLGITVDFAPDTDVSNQPANSVIGDRSYSSDPAIVTKYASATIRGLHDAGVSAVIKHFPGHGHGSGDSHTGKVTTPSLEQLKTVDLLPFKDLTGSGAAVMVGHLDVPGLTAPNVPASTSRLTIEAAVEAALVAGADNALWTSTKAVPQVLDRLQQAVTAGRLPQARVDESVLRMARYKGALQC